MCWLGCSTRRVTLDSSFFSSVTVAEAYLEIFASMVCRPPVLGHRISTLFDLDRFDEGLTLLIERLGMCSTLDAERRQDFAVGL